MEQVDRGLNSTVKRARRREFLDQMNHLVPWAARGESLALYAPEGNGGQSPFSVETMLRVQFTQQWFTLGDRRQKVPCTTRRHCANLPDSTTRQLGNSAFRLPDETAILGFRHLLEKHQLARHHNLLSA